MPRPTEQLRDLRWPLVALGLLLCVNAFFSPGFFHIEFRDGRFYGTIVDILSHAARTGIAAIGMTLVIATGGVDLSVGAVAAVSGAIGAVLVSKHSAPWPVAVLASLICGAALGAWNGALVAFMRMQPIVATLVLMVAGRGVAQLISGGVIVGFDEPALAWLANGALVAIPAPVWLLAAVALAVGVLARRTPFGLFVSAVGDNPRAARIAGIDERGLKLACYSLCGACAATVGLIECSYIKAADANNAGQLLELDAILAVVIGGTSLKGGRFSLLGTLIGAVLLQAMTTTIYMLNVPAEVAPAPKALLVLGVCLLRSGEFRAMFGARRPE
ncbi:MAG: ABC transporter permease [Phycisphaerales bacterium]